MSGRYPWLLTPEAWAAERTRYWPSAIEWADAYADRDEMSSQRHEWLRTYVNELFSGAWGEVLAIWFDEPFAGDIPWEPCAITRKEASVARFLVVSEDYRLDPRRLREYAAADSYAEAHAVVHKLRPWAEPETLEHPEPRSPCLDQTQFDRWLHHERTELDTLVKGLRKWESERGGRLDMRRTETGWTATATSFNLPRAIAEASGDPSHVRYSYTETGADLRSTLSRLVRHAGLAGEVASAGRSGCLWVISALAIAVIGRLPGGTR